MRLDRWLWCARLFKTRSLASEAIQGGHVRVAGRRSKASKEVAVGDELTVVKGPESWVVVVTVLPERRGPAAEARRLYVEDPASVERRELARRDRRESSARPPTPGRPDKRTRRLIRGQRRKA